MRTKHSKTVLDVPYTDAEVRVASKVTAVHLLQSITAHTVLLQAYVLSGKFDGEGDNLKALLTDLQLVDKTIHNYG